MGTYKSALGGIILAEKNKLCMGIIGGIQEIATQNVSGFYLTFI